MTGPITCRARGCNRYAIEGMDWCDPCLEQIEEGYIVLRKSGPETVPQEVIDRRVATLRRNRESKRAESEARVSARLASSVRS